MMTSGQVVEMSVNVTTNIPSQDYTHLDDHNLPTYNINKNKTDDNNGDNHHHHHGRVMQI